MLGAREAMLRQEREGVTPGSFTTFRSEIVRGGQPARSIGVQVTGEEDIYLYVTGEPDVIWGAATWADARLIDAQGQATFLGQGGIEVLEGRFDIDCNMKSGVSGPLAIAGRAFKHGLHVYAQSKVRVPLKGKYHRFEAWIGVDDWVESHGSVRFHVTDAGGARRHGPVGTAGGGFPGRAFPSGNET